MTVEQDADDWFTDEAIAQDPYPYLEDLRSKCPVHATGHHNVVAVTGYDEAIQVFRDTEIFSACVSTAGPFAHFPVALEGDDISETVAGVRDQLPMSQHMVTMDPPDHTRERSLLSRLITPKRLKGNEDYMLGLADRLLDPIVPAGRCEFISQYSQPLATMVIVDLLGVPKEDHEAFREGFGLHQGSPGDLTGATTTEYGGNSLDWLEGWFTRYIEERREEPAATCCPGSHVAKYPDGSTPDVSAAVRTATFLFAAGQETSARMLAQAVRFLAEDPSLQGQLRAHPEGIPNFIEETLRVESPTKTDSRLAMRDNELAGVDIPAGATVALLLNAINHDPRKFDSPYEFQADRPNARDHLAFGRGVHTCPGAPLARTEGRITVERLLQRTRNIRLSEEHHGPASDRHFHYEPTWMLRAMEELYIEFDPA